MKNGLLLSSKVIRHWAIVITALLGFAQLHAQTSALGYAFSSSTGTFTPLAGGTAVTAILADDASSAAIPLGFTFTYMGAPYTQVTANSNGWLSFNASTTASQTNMRVNSLSTANTGLHPLLAPYWDDLMGINGNASFPPAASYQTTGTAGSKIFTMEWLNWAPYSSTTTTATISFQVKLYEATGVIEYIYRQESGAAAAPGASIGITGSSTSFLSLSNTTAAPGISYTASTDVITTRPASNQVYTFTPVTGTPANPIGITFTSVGLTSMNVVWTDNSTNETNFQVYRSTDNISFASAGMVSSSTSSSTGATYSLSQTGLNLNTMYYYRITANNEASSAFLTGSQSTAAASICGNKIVGPSAGADYAALTAAFADFNANGIACPVILELQPSYNSSVETFPLIAGAFPGMSSVNTVTVRPASGATNLSITSSAAQTISINGGQYFTFDGRAGGTGTNMDLTIENTSTSGTAVLFINGGANNNLKYLKVKGVNTSTSNGVVFFSTSTAAAGNNNNIISDCNLFDGATTPVNIIYSSGTTGLENTGNIIVNNSIYNFFSPSTTSRGIFISSGSNAWTISTNSFFQTAARTSTGAALHSAILIATGSGHTISGNFIGGSAANAGGAPWTYQGAFGNRFAGINLSGTGTAAATNVQGNTITNITLNTTSSASTMPGIFSGISAQNGNVNIGTVTPNIIGSATGNGSISIITSSNADAMAFGISSSSSGTVAISNNTIGGVSYSNATSTVIRGNFHGISVNSGTAVISNNLVGSLTTAGSITNSTGNTSTSTTTFAVTSGIVFSGTTAIITNNTISNLSYTANALSGQVTGITASAGTVTITGNAISNLSSTSANTATGSSVAVAGIIMTATGGSQTVGQNNITSLSSTAATGAISIIGIHYAGPATGTNAVSRNLVRGLSATTSGAGIITGINITAGATTFSNNMLDLGLNGSAAAVTGAYTITGILKNTTANNNFYFNTVRIQGAGVTSSAANTYAFRRIATGTDEIKNNIFANIRTNATTGGIHYAIGLNANTGITALNNDYFVSGAVLGNSTSDYATLPAWKAGTGIDNTSISINPNFISSTNLHIDNIAASSLESQGVAVTGIAIDIDGDVRPGPVGSVNGGGTAPDIGADEFDGIPLPPCSGTPTAGNITGASSVCSGAGTMLSLSGATNDPGIVYQWGASSVAGGPYTNMGTAATQTTGNLTTGAYYVVTVTCTNSGQSSVTPEFHVTVNPLPTVAVTPSTALICLPASATALSASGASTYTWSPATGLSATTGATVNALPPASTTYIVTGIDANGCAGSATASITVGATPAVTASATPSTVCTGGSSQLIATATGYQTVNNYSFATSTGVTLDPMTGATTMIGANVDDAPTASPAAIGFSFSYEGVSYTQFSVSPDGWILLGSATATSQFTNVTTNSSNTPKIFPYWDDLSTGTDGGVKALVTGTAPNRILKVQWFVNIPRNTTAPANSVFQAWLYESTGAIEFRYGAMGTPVSGTISSGLTGATPTNFKSVTFSSNSTSSASANDVNTTAPASGRMYIFTPPAPATFLWSPTTFISGQETLYNPLATNITATTTYTAVATTAAGCSSSAPVTVTAGAPLTSSASIAPGTTVCAGTSVTLQAAPSGGGAPYTYTWSGPNGFTSAAQNPTLTANAAAAGTYTVTVSDACSATSVSQVTLAVNALPAVTLSPSSTLYCNPGPGIVLTANGANTYTWSPAAGLSATTGTSVTASPTATTTYMVTGTDANGCQASATAAITSAPAVTGLTASASPGVICAGSTTDLVSTVNPYNVTLYTESFNAPPAGWTTVNNTSGSSTPALTAWTLQPNGYVYSFTTFSSNDNSQFYMTNSDAGGSGNNTNTILQSPAFSTMGLSTCTLKFYHYYNDFNTLDAATVEASTDNVNWTAVQTYTTDQGTPGAFAQATVNLNAYANQPNVYVRFNYTAVYGFYWAIDNVSISGNSSFYTYSWTSAPAGFTSNAQNPTGVAPTATSSYTVMAMNPFGCSATATTSVTVNPLPAVTASAGSSAICTGSTTTLTAAGAASYTWSPATSLSATTGASVTAAPSATTTYIITGTDANSCSNTASVTVTVNPNPSVTITSTDVTCNGQNNGAATATASGGPSTAYTYSWSTTPVQTTATATGLTAGTYTVTVMSGACSAQAAATINQPSSPLSTMMMQTNVSCNGGNDGDAMAMAMGGTSPYTYLWSNGQTTATASSLAASAAPYTVTVTDANGCTATGSVTITEPAALNIAASVNNHVSCFGGNNGSATATAIGGPSTSYTYSWSTAPVQTTATATGLPMGTYTVTVMSGACSTQGAVTIGEPAAPLSVMMMQTNVSCNGANDGDAMAMPMGGTSSYSYQWSNGQTTSAASPLAASATPYTVTVTDANGCTAAGSVTITEPAPIAVSVSATNESCSPGSDAASTVTVTGGSGMYSYTWSDSQTAATATGLTAGSYSVIINDGSCPAITASVTVTGSTAPVITVSNDTTICAGSSATLIATGGSSYLWDNSAGSNDTISVIPANTTVYTVAVTDGNGCTATGQVTVTVEQPVTAGFAYIFGNPASNVTFANTSTNATTYSWNFGDNSPLSTTANPSYFYIQDGIYVVTLIASNGCSSDTISQVLTIMATGIGSSNDDITLDVSPNPSTGLFILTLGNAGADKLRIEVLNAEGQAVYNAVESQLPASYSKEIDLGSLAKGMYFLKLETGSKVVTKRIIIQ